MSGTPLCGIVAFLAGSLWLALHGETTFCVLSLPSLCGIVLAGSHST